MADAGVLSRLFMTFVRIPARLPEGKVVQPPQPRLIVAVKQAISPAFQAQMSGVVQRAVGHGFPPFNLEFPYPHTTGLWPVEMSFADLL